MCHPTGNRRQLSAKSYHHQLVVLGDTWGAGSVWPVGCLALVKNALGQDRGRISRHQQESLVHYQAEGTASVAKVEDCVQGRDRARLGVLKVGKRTESRFK